MSLDKERMQDFFQFVVKGLPEMGIDPEQLEKQVDRENKQSSGEAVGVSSLVAGLQSTLGTSTFTGTIAALWNKIRCVTPHFSTAHPRALSIAIKREEKELNHAGYRVTWITDRGGGKTVVKLTRMDVEQQNQEGLYAGSDS